MTRLLLTVLLALAASCGIAQVPIQFSEIPIVYGNPLANCYNLDVAIAGNDATFSWSRIDDSSACDMNGTADLFFVFPVTPKGVQLDQKPTSFGLTIGKTVTVTLPGPGVYLALRSPEGILNLGALANPGQPLLIPLFTGEWEEFLILFVGTPALWESPRFDHVPFASPLYPAGVSGNVLTFGVSLHGRTLGIFKQTDRNGGVHQFKTEILSDGRNMATLTLPNDFSFEAPISLTLVDATTSLSATWLIYDPIAARLGGRQ
jgi:hypothetical protein